MRPEWIFAAYPLTLCWNFLLWLLVPKSRGWLPASGALLPLIAWSIFLILFPEKQPFLISGSFINLPDGIQWNLLIKPEPLRLVLILILSLLCFLIQLYSIDYLKNVPAQPYFHFLLAAFQMAMAALFLAGNLLTLFIAWELVGLISYLLVQFWYQEKNTVLKAFQVVIINKAGDLLLLAGIGLLCSFGLSFPVHSHLYFPEGSGIFLDSFTGRIVCGFFLVSAAVKSAQFPFSIWLKKAMAGPAAVSALLHSATMVAAGVWLMMQLGPWFPESVLHAMGMLGIFTLIGGSMAALSSLHLKSALAFSTIAQLGLMMAGIGAGLFQEVGLHLMAHAFFKAGLFLICGMLMKQLADKGFSGDECHQYSNLAGLLRSSPWVKTCLGILLASLAGLPLTSGFISKESLMHFPDTGAGLYSWFFYAGMQAGAFLTALYAGRIFLVLTTGSWQTAPLFSLFLVFPVSILTLFSTFLLFGWNPISSEGWLTDFTMLKGKLLFPDVWAMAAGLACAWLTRNSRFYEVLPGGPQFAFPEFKPVEQSLKKTASILLAIAGLSRKTEDQVLGRSLHFASGTVVVAGYFASFTDRFLVDGLLKFSGRFFYHIGGMLFRQTRHSARFGAWLIILVLILLIYYSYYR